MSLVFSEADVAAFAAASGDRNPLHLDPVYARATPFGDCIVQGALLALAALGRLDDEALAGVRRVDASFGGAVLVGEEVEAEVREAPSEGTWQVRISGRGRLLVRVVARLEAGEPDDLGDAPSAGRPMREEPYVLGELPPLDEGLAGAYAGRVVGLASAYGAGALGPALVEALGWASYVVGMELPGLHGVFAAVRLVLADGGAGAGAYALRVAERDPRTEHLVLSGALEPASGGRVVATIESFARPAVPAIDQALLLGEATSSRSGSAAVVVGGSRGFGAAAALALLARGHETYVVHSSPSTVLARAVEAAAAFHPCVADARDASAMESLAERVREAGLPLRAIVLAASPPPLPMAVTASSGRAVAEYVADALALAAIPLGALRPLLADDGYVLFCSSSAVSQPPRDWPHYVAAKGALEGLAAWTAATSRGACVVAARLPKMLTAMTNLPSMRQSAAAPEPVALRLVELLETGSVPAGFTVLEDELR